MSEQNQADKGKDVPKVWLDVDSPATNDPHESQAMIAIKFLEEHGTPEQKAQAAALRKELLRNPEMVSTFFNQAALEMARKENLPTKTKS